MKFKFFIILMSFSFLSSQSLFSQGHEEVKYDFSNFTPLTVEEFVENNFSYLKEYYDADPTTITSGVHFKIIPKGKGFRDQDRKFYTQVYQGLIISAVLEWAQSSGYAISYGAYSNINSGFSIVQNWDDRNLPQLNFMPDIRYTFGDKTLEETFRERNSSLYENSMSGGVSSRRLSSVFNILAIEGEHYTISESRDSAMREQGIKRPDKEAPKSTWLNYLKNNSNGYSAGIELVDSKYGSWGGSLSRYSKTGTITGGDIGVISNMLALVLGYCEAKIGEAQSLFYKKMGIEVQEENIENDDKGNEIVVEFSAEGYIAETRALQKRTLEAANILLSGHVTDESGVEIDSAQIKLKGIDGAAVTDETGTYHLTAKAQGEESYSEVMDIKLQKIALEISHEELGEYKEDKPYGLVSDGFTTLKLKVKAKGIRPNTVSVKQPNLGSFVEQTALKVPLVLNASGEGELEYVPPAYLTVEDLSKKLEIPKLGKLSLPFLWVAEVPIQFTYEDEEGNPGTFEMNIFVTRPPVLPIHGFTGDYSTWADLATYLREKKYYFILREYYEGPADESTIERQSQKLGQYIQETQKAYSESGILQSRVDIVAHSMGGLISRHYISNMAKYGTKAGIVIPYNVKLSREELAAARNQSPVKLIDIRKLIMVGTPNHGATWIDGRIGYLGAFMSNVHEVASSQLRSNSQFLANLNSGENEGRHLDPNVQYALLYGRRRLKSFYPPDNIKFKYSNPEALFAGHVTDDDGVVKVSSAKLNGVIDFAFPEKIDNPYGFIHSPAMSSIFAGDKSITTDIEVLDKVNELLLEDIPRMPLQNSFAKIFGTKGDVSMRYYSTETWQPMSPGTSKNLENYWCQFKTGEGRTRVAFFLNNYHWGSIHIEPNTILRIENASPELVEVYLQQGKARFTSRKEQGGGFEIAMGDETEKWYNFNPEAVVVDINTDFIIDKDESIKVHSIDGDVSVGFSDEKVENMKGKKIEAKGGVELTQFGEMADSPLPDNGWWSSIDTTYLPNETPKKSGIHILEEIKEIAEPLIEKIVEPVLKNTETPLIKEVPKAIPNHLPINEDFSNGFTNWDNSSTELESIDGKLYWEDDDQNPLILKIPIPLQNIIIEFDGWAEENGINIEWFNSLNKGYLIYLGAFVNYKSLIGIKNGKRYDFNSISGAHITFKEWQHYKIILHKDKIEVYIDDMLIGKKMIYENLMGGGTMKFSSYQSRIGIDNVFIYERQ